MARPEGSKAAVMALQAWLRHLGAPIAVDGVVGPETRKALEAHGDSVAREIQKAIAATVNAKGVNKERYLPFARSLAEEIGVSSRLVERVIDMESGNWDPAAHNTTGGGFGARGLMQIRGSGAYAQYRQDVDSSLTPDDLWDPMTNLRVGIWYLKYCAGQAGKNPRSVHPTDHAHVYAVYNLGPGAYRALFSADKTEAEKAVRAQARVLAAGGVAGYLRAVERLFA